MDYKTMVGRAQHVWMAVMLGLHYSGHLGSWVFYLLMIRAAGPLGRRGRETRRTGERDGGKVGATTHLEAPCLKV